jgi:polar amino acid transport system permease protein
MEIVAPYAHVLLMGFTRTVLLAASVLVWGTLGGIVVGAFLLTRRGPLYAVGRVYSDVVRGIPVLVLIFAAYYGTAPLGISLGPTQAARVALSFFCAAQVGEIVRGGISSLSSGYLDAAKALGLAAPARWMQVVLPLSMARMLPPWVNTAVEMIKATSLASLIGVPELLYELQAGAGTTFVALPFYVVGAAAYLVVGYLLSTLARALERRLAYGEY